MTIITVDGTALAEILEPVLRICFSICAGIIFYCTGKIVLDILETNKKRDRLQESRQLYTARKREYEGNEKGWKKWRDANYKITDLVEAETYF